MRELDRHTSSSFVKGPAKQRERELGYRSVDKYININTRADISMQTSFYFKGKKSPKKEKKKKKK
jgi:hypothetical protein